MSDSARSPSRHLESARPPLWVCHGCELIGDVEQAQNHRLEAGCDVAELSPEISDRIRQLWRNDQAHRVGALLAAVRSGSLAL